MGSMEKSIAPQPRRIEFKSEGHKLVGHLYVPPDIKDGDKLPGVIFMTTAGGIKEQTVSNYARKLCLDGYVCLVYDHRTYGESEGNPRGYEHPATKIHDAGNVISFMQTSIAEIDPKRIGALGVCAGGSYLTVLAIQDKRIKALATVSAMMNRGGAMSAIPPAQLAQMIDASNKARHQFTLDGSEMKGTVIARDADANSSRLEREVFDYYRTPRAGTATFPTYDPQIFLGSIQELLIWNVVPMCKKMGDTPFLGVVGANAQTRQQTELAYAEIPGAKKELLVVEGATHISLYDTPEQVAFVSKKIVMFFDKYLKNNK